MGMGDPLHWDDRFRSIGADAVSWYEARPSTSLDLFAVLGVRPDHSVIDAGGGASKLVDHLLAAGHHAVTVLDISAVALDTARSRLSHPDGVTWIKADLLTWQPTRRWDVWHDRAVLHFLVDDADRATYLETLHRALTPGGAFVIATFADDGPSECSALPVRRYSRDDLRALLGDVEVVEERRHLHLTPSGAEQPFNWIAGRRRA